MSRAIIHRILACEMITDQKTVNKTYRLTCNGKNFDKTKVIEQALECHGTVNAHPAMPCS